MPAQGSPGRAREAAVTRALLWDRMELQPLLGTPADSCLVGHSFLGHHWSRITGQPVRGQEGVRPVSQVTVYAALRCHPIAFPQPKAPCSRRTGRGLHTPPPSAHPTPGPGNHQLAPAHVRAVTACRSRCMAVMEDDDQWSSPTHPPRASHCPYSTCPESSAPSTTTITAPSHRSGDRDQRGS